MGDIAREAILRYPETYLSDTLGILSHYRNAYDPHTFTTNPHLDQIATTTSYFRSLHPGRADVPGNSKSTRITWQLGQFVTMLSYTLSIGGILILLLPFLLDLRQRLASTVFIIVFALLVVGTSLTAKMEYRYVYTFAPFAWLLLAATSVMIGTVIVATVRQRPWVRSRGPES